MLWAAVRAQQHQVSATERLVAGEAPDAEPRRVPGSDRDAVGGCTGGLPVLPGGAALLELRYVPAAVLGAGLLVPVHPQSICSIGPQPSAARICSTAAGRKLSPSISMPSLVTEIRNRTSRPSGCSAYSSGLIKSGRSGTKAYSAGAAAAPGPEPLWCCINLTPICRERARRRTGTLPRRSC